MSNSSSRNDLIEYTFEVTGKLNSDSAATILESLSQNDEMIHASDFFYHREQSVLRLKAPRQYDSEAVHQSVKQIMNDLSLRIRPILANDSASDLQEYYFEVRGPHCSGCTTKIVEKLSQKNEMIHNPACFLNAQQSLLKFTAPNKFDSKTINKQVNQVMSDLGFSAKPINNKALPKTKFDRRWLWAAAGLGSGALLLLISVMGVSLPLPALITIGMAATGLTMFLGVEFYRHALRSFLRSGDLNMDTLFALSTITILTVSVGAFFVPWLPMMFEAGLLIFGFRHLGLAVENSLFSKVASNVKIQKAISPNARVLEKGEVQYKPLAKINRSFALQKFEPQEINQLKKLIKEKKKEVDAKLFNKFQKISRLKQDYNKVLFTNLEVKQLKKLLENNYQDALNTKLRIKNDVLLIKAGEIIPVDGVCLQEGRSICASIQSGSRHPRDTVVGEELIAGTILAEGSDSLELRVMRPPEQSNLARFDKDTQTIRQKPIQTVAATILKYFVPGVIMAAIASAIAVSVFFPPSTAIACGVAVLVSACPCVLGMIIPLSIKIGMDKAKKHGVHFKNSETMQAIGSFKAKKLAVVLDYHGTLTHNRPIVKGKPHLLTNQFSEAEFLQCIHLMEAESSHPVAQSLCRYVKLQKITLANQPELKNLDQKSNHSGVSAEINGQRFVLGNVQMMNDNGIPTQHIKAARASGETLIYLACEKQVVGYLKICDPLRNGAHSLVEYFKKKGAEVSLCTGADAKTAEDAAKKLAIDSVHAGQRPTSGEVHPKRARVMALQKQGYVVLYIGDGPNDAPALNRADMRFVMKTDNDLFHRAAQSQADAVIEAESLHAIIAAFDVAKQTMTNIKQNLLLSLGYNIFAMTVASGLLLAVGFSIHPAVGAGLMVLQSGLILLNAYRFKQQGVKYFKAKQTFESIRHSHQNMMQHFPRDGQSPEVLDVNASVKQQESFRPLFSPTNAKLQSQAPEHDEQQRQSELTA